MILPARPTNPCKVSSGQRMVGRRHAVCACVCVRARAFVCVCVAGIPRGPSETRFVGTNTRKMKEEAYQSSSHASSAGAPRSGLESECNCECSFFMCFRASMPPEGLKLFIGVSLSPFAD